MEIYMLLDIYFYVYIGIYIEFLTLTVLPGITVLVCRIYMCILSMHSITETNIIDLYMNIHS